MFTLDNLYMCDFISLFMYFVNSKKSYIDNLVLMIFLMGKFCKN
jgi:hypothetical protein